MVFVGAYSNFKGAKERDNYKFLRVRVLEKLGHSRGRAERFLKEYRRQDQLLVVDDKSVVPDIYRSVVFVLPENFRLRNDVIQAFIKELKCGWDEAKFHAYRISAVDIMGKSDDWKEVLGKNEQPTTEPAPISETAGPDTNVKEQKEVESLP